ncbi:hypothetical protein ACHAWC_006242 [Mediolabrus comicus]
MRSYSFILFAKYGLICSFSETKPKSNVSLIGIGQRFKSARRRCELNGTEALFLTSAHGCENDCEMNRYILDHCNLVWNESGCDCGHEMDHRNQYRCRSGYGSGHGNLFPRF